MKTCLKCGKVFPFEVEIDGKTRNLGGRKYCLDCSAFGKHNTRSIHLTTEEKMSRRVKWNRHYVSDEIKSQILSEYKSGLSYTDLCDKFKVSTTTIGSIVKGIRTLKEAYVLAKANGKYKLSDEGRLKLSENGKRAVNSGNKIWTKPEREFKNILNEEKIGVKFPEIVKETLGLKDDDNASVFFQYPFQRYIVDFYDAEFNTIYQINGDYWHGNPLLYDQNKLSKIQQNNIRHDKNRMAFFNKRGINILTIWESEIYWNKNLVRGKIWEVRKQVNPSVLHTECDGIVTHTSYHIDEDWNNKVKKLWFKIDKIIRPKKEKVMVDIVCPVCKKAFRTQDSGKKTYKCCSEECRCVRSRKVVRPTKEQLELDILNMSMVAIGKKYGVSDNAVRKWIKT